VTTRLTGLLSITLTFTCMTVFLVKIRIQMFLQLSIFLDLPSRYEKLLPQLENSPFKILVCFRTLNFLTSRGLDHIRHLGNIRISSTGRQCFTAHIYAKTKDDVVNVRIMSRKGHRKIFKQLFFLFFFLFL
jgi:hypothetical protein